MKASRWHRAPGQLAWIMGVLNCTPDSFSDGGRFVGESVDAGAAAEHALTMHEQGAAIIDVGGESTRPGARPVSLEDELARTVPVIRALAGNAFTISIDTSKSEVMQRAIEAGATLVNDVTALSGDAESPSVVADAGVDVCLMHMQGTPQTMQQKPRYRDVVDEVLAYLEAKAEAAVQAGISESSILIDPGIGFGKRLEDNLTLIAGLERFKQALSLPLLMGVSRKSFLGALTGSEATGREIETVAAVTASILGGCDVVRVHDVEVQRKGVLVASALRDASLRLA